MSRFFFGYPERPPATGEVMRNAAASLAKGKQHDVVTWQSLAVGGRIVIQVVIDAIRAADFGVFDVTRPNPNVLFEAGFAIGIGKPVWLTRDATVSGAAKDWNELALLKPVGYEEYRNSGELHAKLRDGDLVDAIQPLYDTLIEPAIPDAVTRTSLLYCPTFEPYEAANRLSVLVEQRRTRGLEVFAADPTESSLLPLHWYAEKIAGAAGVLINFAGRSRNRSWVHNLRHAFVAGLAEGLEIPVLMLAEDDYAAPFDYEHRLKVYETAAAALGYARPWIDRLAIEGVRSAPLKAAPRSRLAGLRLGEHVAENELADLEDYFVQTAAYEDVLLSRDALFVGHRGTGKTANALRAFEEISANKDNLALLIKPAGFEFPGLLAAIDRLPEHAHDYLFDTLWRFLVQTELAASVVAGLDARPNVPKSVGERALLEYVEAAPFDVRAELSVRLDQALSFLLRATAGSSVSLESGRILVNEAFHEEALAKLRQLLGTVLKGKKRVAVIIDNLDKGWQREARLDILARLILGLLSARGHLVRDFQRQDWWRDEIKLTMAIFLRSDIFTYVRRAAREPDKLSPSTITWKDAELLEAVLQERLRAAWPLPTKEPALWGDLFSAEVEGTPTRDFIMSHVMPRPRDVVYFANAAIARAIDRRQEQVREAELLAARDTYSQYAYEALLVENGITIPEMESVLYGFLGAAPIVSQEEVLAAFARAGLGIDRHGATLRRLIEMSFLAVEVRENQFVYPEVGPDLTRALALAEKQQPVPDRRRYQIHAAFRSFLEVGAA
jgi:hypothetical protein